MIIIGIMFSYWLGFTVLVPGSYYMGSVYDSTYGFEVDAYKQVKGGYMGSIHEPTYGEVRISNCLIIHDANEIPKGIMYHVVKASTEKGIQDKIPKDIIEYTLQHGTTGVIPPIEAHLFVSKLSDAVLHHVIYGEGIPLCFVYNDLEYSVHIKFSFEPYIGD